MATAKAIEKVADNVVGHGRYVRDALKEIVEKVEEKEHRFYNEHSHKHGVRSVHAAVRAPILFGQGLRIQAINSVGEAFRGRLTNGIYEKLDTLYKPSGDLAHSFESEPLLLVHRTSPFAGRSISSSLSMRPGREGTLGAGIYFAESAAACAKKAQTWCPDQEYALVTATVDLGRCRVVESLHELGWRMVRDCGFGKDDLEKDGFTSVATNFHGGWEYCVFEPSRVRVEEVTFWRKGTRGSEDFRISTYDARPDAPARPSSLHTALVRTPGSTSWESYSPHPNVVVVLAPGAALRKHAVLYEYLEGQGYEVEPVLEKSYDHFPPGTDMLKSFGISGPRMPDIHFNHAKNLETFVDDIVLPKILQLVADGRGPAAVIAASRGGGISMPRLWEIGWRGPSVVGNAGFIHSAQSTPIPASVSCVLVTGGCDSLVTRDPETTESLLQKEDPSNSVYLYHDPEEDHKLNRLTGPVLGKLVKLATSGHFHDSSELGANLRVL